MEKVLIKGAGDLATGIACRLHRCGFSVAMTEIAVPTTVRRTVAFSRAVYEGNALVEDIEGVLCRNTEEIENTVNQDKVAVIVDPSCETLKSWRPDIVVDAILAKVNLGSKMSDADIVIGVRWLRQVRTVTWWWRRNAATIWDAVSGKAVHFRIRVSPE